MTIEEFKIQLALGSLSKDDKLKLAKSKRTSKKILTILSKDDSWFVLWHIIDNSNTPKEVLKKLSKDENSVIRRSAIYNLNER